MAGREVVDRHWRIERWMSPAEARDGIGGWEALRTCNRMAEALKWITTYREDPAQAGQRIRLVLITVEEIPT